MLTTDASIGGAATVVPSFGCCFLFLTAAESAPFCLDLGFLFGSTSTKSSALSFALDGGWFLRLDDDAGITVSLLKTTM